MKNGREIYLNVFKKVFPDMADDEYENMQRGNPMVWDSLHHIQLINGLETAFSVSLGVDAIINFKSFYGGMKLLQKKYNIEIT